ncbi:hypothetical protein P7K49_023838, partial [Saguinus oedipus]
GGEDPITAAPARSPGGGGGPGPAGRRGDRGSGIWSRSLGPAGLQTPHPSPGPAPRAGSSRPAGSAASLFIVEPASPLPARPPAPFSPPPERKKSQSVETN